MLSSNLRIFESGPVEGRVLVVGKPVCNFALEAFRNGRLEDVFCIDDVEDAERVMDDGYDCDAIVIERSMFASSREAKAWASKNAHVKVMLVA